MINRSFTFISLPFNGEGEIKKSDLLISRQGY
jgi:hypothetical protein